MVAQNNNSFVFALAPADPLVNQGAIDYATSDSIKLWKVGLEPL